MSFARGPSHRRRRRCLAVLATAAALLLATTTSTMAQSKTRTFNADEFKTIPAGVIFWDQYYNGGIEQFFFNPSGAIAPDVGADLRELGLARDAEVLDQAIGVFPAPYPIDPQARRSRLRRHKDWDEALEKLSAPEAEQGELVRAMIDFAVREGILPR